MMTINQEEMIYNNWWLNVGQKKDRQYIGQQKKDGQYIGQKKKDGQYIGQKKKDRQYIGQRIPKG
jgi:hypothetical protein